MNRRTVLLVGVPTLAVALLIACADVFVLPYYRGDRAAREVPWIPSSLLELRQDSQPVVIRNKDEMVELIRIAKIRSRGPDGMEAFEESMKGFDFSEECLVLVPISQNLSYDVGFSRPYLRSRNLSCHVWFEDRTNGWTSCGGRIFCKGVAVNRKQVDVAHVTVGSRPAITLDLRD